MSVESRRSCIEWLQQIALMALSVDDMYSTAYLQPSQDVMCSKATARQVKSSPFAKLARLKDAEGAS
jgi:hypothetical protein